jgi:hypothetical protein
MGAMFNVIYFYVSFVYIIMHLEMLIHGLVGQHGFGLIARLRLKKLMVIRMKMGLNWIETNFPRYHKVTAVLYVVQSLIRIKRD